jgi:Tfp pilus assembly protein PilX
MKSTRFRNQDGVVLVVVLTLLTLFAIVGLTFAHFAAEKVCVQNPTIEIRDEKCVHEIGPDRR